MEIVLYIEATQLKRWSIYFIKFPNNSLNNFYRKQQFFVSLREESVFFSKNNTKGKHKGNI